MGCYVRCLPAAPGSQGRARTPRATDIASTGLSGSLGGAARHARRQECRQIRSHIIALVQVTIDVVMLAPLADFSAVPAINGVQWSYLVILGGVHTCLMYILMYSAFQKLPTPLIAVMSFIYPVVAIIVDRVFFGHVLLPLQFFGIALISAGRLRRQPELGSSHPVVAPRSQCCGISRAIQVVEPPARSGPR